MLLLTMKIPNLGFLVVESSLRMFYGRHHDMLNSYGIAVSQMTKVYVPFVVTIIRSFPHSRFIAVCNKSNKTGATSAAGTSYPSRAPELIPRFLVGFVLFSLVFCVVFCRPFVCPFVLLYLAIVLSVIFD
jgi:hypothetical protein